MKKDIVDADQLRAFQAVAETGSFTRAAAKLGAAQSSISHQIAQLEKRAGRLLIRRTTRRVQLTPAGTAMLVYVRSILEMADDARRQLNDPPIEGVVKVGIADEFAATKLASVLGIFRNRHPRFRSNFLPVGTITCLRPSRRAWRTSSLRNAFPAKGVGSCYGANASFGLVNLSR